MNYIDHSLINIVLDEQQISSRDVKLINDLCKRILTPDFLTEKQAKLLVKIIKNNYQHTNIDITLLNNPMWSKPFRFVNMVKKLYIEDNVIVIEFTFSTTLKNVMNNLNKSIISLKPQGRFYHADLTEKNIKDIVSVLTPHNFDIDPKLKEYYDLIESWNEAEIIDQYRINTIKHQNFQKIIGEDLGINTPLTTNLIADRSTRYQYYIDKIDPTSLTEKIAYRGQPRIWLNSTEYELEDIISSLIELKRFPLLVVFDHRESKKTLAELDRLHNALSKNNITTGVGIYFRLSNNDQHGKEFNQKIANYQYNQHLDITTQVVGVQPSKLPKFMLANDWKPMSVISINDYLRHNKTAIYAANCDCIISYTEKEPIIEPRNMWVLN